MITHRCHNCIWWDNQHPMVAFVPTIPGKLVLGFCRKHKPGAERINGYYYGVQPAPAITDSIADPGGVATYGYLEGLWKSDFCKTSAATRPSSWGSIKAIYK